MRLAHYTSIDTLALILDSEKIRFTRLDNLDDINEIGIYPSFAHKFFYVSCWSDPFNELIPQWSMYGGNKRGVIILLDSDFIDIPIYDTELIDSKESNNYSLCIQGPNLNKPFKIKYLDHKALKDYAESCLHVGEFGEISIFAPLGMYKSKDWSFQNEYRYIIQVNQHKGENHKCQEDFIYDKTYIDIPLKDGYKNNMQILIGPMCSKSDRIIINSLCEIYKIDNRVESKYNGVLIK